MENQLNSNQREFLEISKKYEKAKEDLKLIKTELDAILSSLEVNSYFQDPETMAVYHIAVPKGKFVTFDTLEYQRTAFVGEAKGSLSKKEAESKGFYLGK